MAQFTQKQQHSSGSERNNRLSAEQLIYRLLELLSAEGDFHVTGRQMLQLVGECFGADRACVFKYTDGGTPDAEKLFDWTNPDIEQPEPAGLESFDACGEQLLHASAFFISAPATPMRLLGSIRAAGTLSGIIGLDWIQGTPAVSEREAVEAMAHIVNLFQLLLQREEQQEKLLECISQQRQIMDNISIPILLVDCDYRVLAANPHKKVAVDMPLQQLLGTHCYDTVCKFGSPPEFCAVAKTMQTRQPSRSEFSFMDKRLISTAQPIFDRNGEMQSILSVDVDITELTRQKEELKYAMEQAQAANHAKSYFLATVSHELRTPLNAVIGFSELLQNGEVDEKTRQEYLHSINFAGNSLLNLINDVLDLSNLEANRTLIAPEKTDVAALLTQVAAVFKLSAQQKNIELAVHADAIRHPLYVDSQRMRQILVNLLGNAIKFTTSGGVSLHGGFVPETEEQGLLTLQVSDTGIGIAPENQKDIFEPFVHDSLIRGTRMYEGSGLGLTISRKLLETMGGGIHLDSTPGRGSTFTIELKVKYEPVAAASGKADTAAITPVAASPGKPLRMLLVDDVPINLKVLAAMLERLQVKCTLAESAESALRHLKEDRAYDMILTDMWMPGIGGGKLAETIRTELGITDIPILAVTADTQIDPEVKKSFTYIIHKPITLKSLEQAFEFLAPPAAHTFAATMANPSPSGSKSQPATSP